MSAISGWIARLTRQVKVTAPAFHLSVAPLHLNGTKVVSANMTNRRYVWIQSSG